MKIETKFKLGALAIVAIMLFVAIAPIKTEDSIQATEAALDDSIERELRVGSMLDLLRDAETGQRGYIITGKESFLGGYYSAVEQMPRLRNLLQPRPSDGEDYARTMRDILRLTDLKLAEMRETVELRRSSGYAKVEPIVSSERGKRYMDELRVLISHMEDTEAERRSWLQRQLRGSVSSMVNRSLGATMANLLLLATLLMLMFRLLKDRQQTVLELDDTASQLSKSNLDAQERNRQMQLSAEMLNALGTVGSLDETSRIIASYCAKLLPANPGILYLYRNSRDILEAQAVWGKIGEYAETTEPESCWALRRGQPHMAHGPHDLCCTHYTCGSGSDATGHLCVPLVTQGEVIGLIAVEGIHTDATAGDPKLALVMRIAEQVALALNNVQLRETLQRQSIIDPLTGLFNRRFMDETVHRELLRAQRKGINVSLLVLDLDHFKRLNDTYGHDAGDAALKATAHAIRSSIRESDLACRFGGEEIVVILPECDGVAAMDRADKIRGKIAALDLQHSGRAIGTVTASLGVAVFPEHGANAEALLRAADQALYRAKHGGRNRVVLAGPEPEKIETKFEM